MAQTQPFKAVVSELTKYGFKISERPGLEFTYSKPEYRKELFVEPGEGDEVEVIQWSKDKKDPSKIWVSSIAVLNGGDIPDDIFGDETELNNSRAKQPAPVAPQPPPVGKFPTKYEMHKTEYNIVYGMCLNNVTHMRAMSSPDSANIWKEVIAETEQLVLDVLISREDLWTRVKEKI